MRDIIAIGASAGGVQALVRLVAGLPADLPAAVFITVHTPANRRSYLPEILTRAGALKAVHPKEGSAVQFGRIFVAPPDRHLMVESGLIHLSGGFEHNRFRPAVDPMFRSAAMAYGPRVVGVVLTGSLADGTVGLGEIKRGNGVAVVQDPEDAMFAEMPENALSHVEVDHLVRLAEMPGLLVQLATTQTRGSMN